MNLAVFNLYLFKDKLEIVEDMFRKNNKIIVLLFLHFALHTVQSLLKSILLIFRFMETGIRGYQNLQSKARAL